LNAFGAIPDLYNKSVHKSRDIACIGYLVDARAPQGPYFELAIIHHTDCGSTLLADDYLRHGFAERIGTDERTLADTRVLDPARTVQTDVNRVLWAGPRA
jgi:carbonic anhydrase